MQANEVNFKSKDIEIESIIYKIGWLNSNLTTVVHYWCEKKYITEDHIKSVTKLSLLEWFKIVRKQEIGCIALLCNILY